jgi:hypothetical protein
MEQRPSWEADSFSAGQEIPCILWNLKVHYHITTCLYPEPALNFPNASNLSDHLLTPWEPSAGHKHPQ